MGCCNPRPSLPRDAPEDERAIITKEAELGYDKNAAIRNLEVIKKNSDGTKITLDKFNTIAQELGLNLTDVDSPDMPLCMFYQKLKEKGKYDQLKLSLVGVLLGRGSGKAALLFDCIANDSRASLESAEVRALFDALFHVSADALPVLVKAQEAESETPGQSLASSKFTEYITNLKAGKDSLAERFTNLVMKGRGKVTQQDFVGAFGSDENLKALETPIAVRVALKREALIVQPAAISKPALTLLGKGHLEGHKK